jgi:hypothetical protein
VLIFTIAQQQQALLQQHLQKLSQKPLNEQENKLYTLSDFLKAFLMYSYFYPIIINEHLQSRYELRSKSIQYIYALNKLRSAKIFLAGVESPF